MFKDKNVKLTKTLIISYKILLTTSINMVVLKAYLCYHCKTKWTNLSLQNKMKLGWLGLNNGQVELIFMARNWEWYWRSFQFWDYYLFCSFIVDEVHPKVKIWDLTKRNNFDNIIIGFDFLFSIPYWFKLCLKFTTNMILIHIWILELFFLFFFCFI